MPTLWFVSVVRVRPTRRKLVALEGGTIIILLVSLQPAAKNA